MIANENERFKKRFRSLIGSSFEFQVHSPVFITDANLDNLCVGNKKEIPYLEHSVTQKVDYINQEQFNIKVVLNNYAFVALVDSGATRFMISKKVANVMGLKYFPVPNFAKVTGADGNELSLAGAAIIDMITFGIKFKIPITITTEEEANVLIPLSFIRALRIQTHYEHSLLNCLLATNHPSLSHISLSSNQLPKNWSPPLNQKGGPKLGDRIDYHTKDNEESAEREKEYNILNSLWEETLEKFNGKKTRDKGIIKKICLTKKKNNNRARRQRVIYVKPKTNTKTKLPKELLDPNSEAFECRFYAKSNVTLRPWTGVKIPVRCTYVGEQVELCVQPVNLPLGVYLRNTQTDTEVPNLILENLSNKAIVIQRHQLVCRAKRVKEIARFMINGDEAEKLYHCSTNVAKFSLRPAKTMDTGAQARSVSIDPSNEEKSFDFSMLKVGENLTEEQKAKLKKLIDQFKSRFALGLSDLEDTNLPPVEFDVGDSKPYFAPSRRFSPKEHDAIDREVAELVR